MIDNLELFKFCLKNPEPIMDESYFKHNNLIIGKTKEEKTQLVKSNLELLETLSAYSFSKKNGESTSLKLDKILKLMSDKNINYSEFVSFWSTLDMSHSNFLQLDKNKQKDVLKVLVEKYLEHRHNLYLTHGYSNTTLQVGKDAKAHKENGSLGVRKVAKILADKKFKNCNLESLESFKSSSEKKFLESDKKGKRLFKEFLENHQIKFSWSSSKEEKMPDFLIKKDEKILIVEHKHIKEGGGGQDKQINEIITFINFGEENKNIHYISFLDGSYFNLFINPSSDKIKNQINQIEKNLKNNPKNYFINTAGFEKLLQNLV